MERPLVSGFEYSKVVHERIVPLLKGCRVGGFQETFRNQGAALYACNLLARTLIL